MDQQGVVGVSRIENDWRTTSSRQSQTGLRQNYMDKYRCKDKVKMSMRQDKTRGSGLTTLPWKQRKQHIMEE